MTALENSNIVDFILIICTLIILYLLGCCLYYFILKPGYKGIVFGCRRLFGKSAQA
jgi:hypothetical protein